MISFPNKVADFDRKSATFFVFSKQKKPTAYFMQPAFISKPFFDKLNAFFFNGIQKNVPGIWIEERIRARIG